MLRIVIVAAAFVAAVHTGSWQDVGVLQIKVVLVDADRKPAPVPRHALLISDNPASAPPRRVVTSLDGTATVRLRPGNYTVESDQPVALDGKSYEWRQDIDIAAGRDTILQLTLDNAEVAAAAPADASGAPASDPGFLLPRNKDSIVAIWTPTSRGSGFAVDASGLIVTSQRLVGTATVVEVQLTPAVKVAAAVLVSDRDRDVAVLRIDAKVAAALRPAPLTCQVPKAPLTDGQDIYTISAPMRRATTLTRGMVTRSDADGLWSDFILARGGAGGPVFDSSGDIVGITSIVERQDRVGRSTVPLIRRGNVCETVAAAVNAAKPIAAPDGALLPVDPERPFPAAALKDAAKRFAGNLTPLTLTSPTFEVAFITPLLTFAAQEQANQRGQRSLAGGTSAPAPERLQSLLDFGVWTDYVGDFPPVLLVRVTPRFVEGFWTRVGRYAARTQGVALPPFKRLAPGFLHLRAYCGAVEVKPVHPFKIEQRISETEAVYEGLYAFDAAAFSPDCGVVKLELYSEKEPAKADTQVVDPKIVAQLWQDFAPYRQ